MRLGAALTVALAPSLHASAQAPLGGEFQVNALFTPGTQNYPAVAAGVDGRFVVAWQDLDYDSVFLRFFDADGDPAGVEVPVNDSGLAFEILPAVARGANGTFVVVWMSVSFGFESDIVGRRFDAAGNALGNEFLVNTYLTGVQHRPAVASDSEGNFVVVWTSASGDSSGNSVRGRRFDADGTPLGNDTQINNWTMGDQRSPAVAMAANGSFVVVWQSDGQDESDEGVFGRRFDSWGAAQGGEFPVNTYTTGNQQRPAVTSDAAGNFAVVWEGESSIGWSIRRRLFDAAGTPLTGEVLVNNYVTTAQGEADVASDSAGNFVATWQSPSQDGSGFGIMRRRFANWQLESQVNSFTTGNQLQPAIAWDGHGRFVVVWTSYGQDGSGGGIFGQWFSDLIFEDGFPFP
jgi:hypothetical protein